MKVRWYCPLVATALSAGLILAACQGESGGSRAAASQPPANENLNRPAGQLSSSEPWKPVTLKQGSLKLGFENLSNAFDAQDGKLRVPRSDGSTWVADLHKGRGGRVVVDGDASFTVQISEADGTTMQTATGKKVMMGSSLALPMLTPGRPPKDISLQIRVTVLLQSNRTDRTTAMLTLDQSIVGIAGLRVRPVEGSLDRALIIVGTEVVLVKLE